MNLESVRQWFLDLAAESPLFIDLCKKTAMCVVKKIKKLDPTEEKRAILDLLPRTRKCLFVSGVVVFCVVVLLMQGGGESWSEKNARMARAVRAKMEEERRIAEARAAAAEEERRVEEEKVKMRLEEVARQTEERRKKEAEEQEEREKKYKELCAIQERRASKSIYKMPLEKRERFNSFCGFDLGSSYTGNETVDPHQPRVLLRRIKPDCDQSKLGTFSNAVAELVYTPVTKKLAYIHLKLTQENVNFNATAKDEVYWLFKHYYNLYYDENVSESSEYSLANADFFIRTEEQARYDNGDEKCADQEEPIAKSTHIYGYDAECYSGAVDDKVLCASYQYDHKLKMANYDAYVVNTNLANLINDELKNLQERAIEIDSKDDSKSLDSFCGIKFGESYDAKLDWGYGATFKRRILYSNGSIKYQCEGQNAARKKVSCNKFRKFEKEAVVYCSPITKKVFRIDILADSELYRYTTSDSKDLYEAEYERVISVLEEKYKVKHYRLTYGNRYRITPNWYRRHKECLFVLGSTKLYLIDSHSSSEGGSGALALVCFDDKFMESAFEEEHRYVNEKKVEGADVWFNIVNGNICIFGKKIGTKIEEGKDYDMRNDLDRRCRYVTEDLDFNLEGRRFRGFHHETVNYTWSSHIAYSVVLSGGKEWGYFSGDEEAENIKEILSTRLKVSPVVSAWENGKQYSYGIGNVVVEFRVGYCMQLEVKNLTLERQSSKEYADEKNFEKTKIESEQGSSAL